MAQQLVFKTQTWQPVQGGYTYIPIFFFSFFFLYSLIFEYPILLLYLFLFLKPFNVPSTPLSTRRNKYCLKNYKKWCHNLIYKEEVGINHKVVCSDVCNEYVHIGCSYINRYIYRKLQTLNAPWYFKKDLKKLMSFSNVTNNTLNRLFVGK